MPASKSPDQKSVTTNLSSSWSSSHSSPTWSATRSPPATCLVKAEAMGLTFKPSKCRTLSIQGGSVKSCMFYLLDKDGARTPLATMEDDPTKFLGSSLNHRNTLENHHKFLQDKLESIPTSTRRWCEASTG